MTTRVGNTTRQIVRKRNVPLYGVLATLAIGCGLLSRNAAYRLPAILQKNLGDAIWAAMVFFLVAMLFPRRNTRGIALVTLLFSLCIEFSQLYHAPRIDGIRSYRIGHLVLGSGFRWADMGCYAIGVGVAAGVDFLLQKRRSSVD